MKLYDHKMISFVDKVMVIGGSSIFGVRQSTTEMLEMVKSSTGQYEWIVSDQSLKHSRSTPFNVLSGQIALEEN